MENKIPVGVLRIGKDLKIYEKTKNSWKISKTKFPEAVRIASLFKSNNRFNELIDKKNPRFLKGQLSSKGDVQGARINILPNGEKLDKAYSLFSKNLVIHDESSKFHWDVMYQNPGGTFSYVYTLKKKSLSKNKKFKKVEEFGKRYGKLCKNVLDSLNDKKDSLAVPMYTLIETHMRVGNEIYYKAHGHKGLTTLKKKDVKVTGNNVKFNFLAKDGVPMIIEKKFPDMYVKRLKEILKTKKSTDFIFTDKKGVPLKDMAFMEAFKKYCGEKFYPHIIRSYYATEKANEFLKKNKHPTKKQVSELFTSIAENLGHKKFSKKKNEWESNYNVTVHYYLNPRIVSKIDKATIKSKIKSR